MDKNRIIKKLNILAVAVLILMEMLLCISVKHYGVLAEENDYTPVITTEQKTVHRGQTFTINVDLSENEGLISLYLSLKYDDTAMCLTGVERGTALNTLTFTTTNSQTTIGYDIVSNFFWDGTSPDKTNGKLVTFTFESFSNAPIGTYPITLTFDRINTNKDYGTPVSVNITNGSVKLVKGEFEAVYYDWDGTELYRKDYNADEMPSFAGETPTRAADECYSYSFKEWKGIVSDEENVIKYKAEYTLTPQIYQVFYFVDGINNDYFDGVIDEINDYYKAEEVAYGVYLENEYPVKARYVFSGWFSDDKFSEPFTETNMPARDLKLYGYFVYDIRTTQIPKIKLGYSEIEGDIINVYADMVINTGFNGMVLTLDYDKSAMEFVGYTRGETFDGLQFDTTNTESGSAADEFKFYYEHSENTYETGNFLKLKFRLLSNETKGVFNVTFTLGNTDATYINGSSGIRYTDIEIIGASVPIGKLYEWEKSAEDNAGIVVKSSNGMPVDTTLKVALVPQSVHNIDNSVVKNAMGKDLELMSVYRLQLIRVMDGAEIEVEPDGTLTVEIKLTELQQACKSLELCYINDAGEITRFESEIDGDILRFKTDHLSLWALVGEVNAVSGTLSDAAVMLITMPIMLAIATMSYVLILIGKNKKNKEKIDE